MKDLRSLERYRERKAELDFYGVTGDSENGMFKIYVNGKSFFVVASNGGGWDHVSVSPCSKTRRTCPTWEEMCQIKNMFFDPEECVVQYHPRKSQYINVYPYCLHLWRRQEGFPEPPSGFVGPDKDGKINL